MSDFTFVHKWVQNQSKRTLLMLHGTGGNENDLLSLGESLDSSANFLSLRGNSREEGTNRFFRRLSDGVFDEEDLRLRTTELNEFLFDAETRHVFSRANTIAVGYSNGANIAASLLLMYPGAIGGAVLFRAMAPFRKILPSSGKNSPVFVLSGNRDPFVSDNEKKLLLQELRSANCEVTSQDVVAGHELTPKDIDLAKAWLANRDS
jgi:phospholipase/carboxylesterase